MNAPAGELQKVRSSMMNAVHDLPLLVARDEGFFRDEGLDVEILKTPGSGQHASDHRALRDDIFKRTPVTPDIILGSLESGHGTHDALTVNV